MTRKRIIIAGRTLIFVCTLCCIAMFLRPARGVSNVRIGFAGYEVKNGKRQLLLIVTNGSSYRISCPSEHDFTLSGQSANGSYTSMASTMTACSGFGELTWGWWQLRIPKHPNIAPGATYRFAVPVEEGPYSWEIAIPLRTIPFQERLPYILRAHWPSSGDPPISFNVTLAKIPPPFPPLRADPESEFISVSSLP